MLQAKPEGPRQACFSFQNVSKCSGNTCYALRVEGRHKQKMSPRPRRGGSRRRDLVCSVRTGKGGPREGLGVSGGSEAAGLGLAPWMAWLWTSHCSSPAPRDSGRRLAETLQLWEGDTVSMWGPEKREVGGHPSCLVG